MASVAFPSAWPSVLAVVSFPGSSSSGGGGASPRIAWSLEPGVLFALVVFGLLYLRAWTDARASASRHPPSVWRLVLFMGGLAAIVVALISPVDELGSQLMVMHMLQHVLLLDIAPILMILGLTKVLLRPATRRLQAVERRAGFLGSPWFAVIAYAGLMWLWHIPAMYDAALRNANIHALEHVCFALAGGLYWWHLLSPIRGRMRLGGMGPVMYMVITKLLVGVLGVVLAFAPTAIYSFYAHHPHYWGLSPREDENLAGLLMALEQSVVMGIALVWLFVRMLNESEREQQRSERYGVA
jgi:cytochrome c oxidase assembly factor CtaG